MLCAWNRYKLYLTAWCCFLVWRIKIQQENWTIYVESCGSSSNTWFGASLCACSSWTLGPCDAISVLHETRRIPQFCADLLERFISRAEVVAQTAILFFPGQKVGRIKLVSHLFQQLDRAEINDFLRFLTAVFSIVSAICGFPLVFKHQYVCTGTAESGEIERRREGNGELSPTDEMCLYLVQFHSQGCGISIQVWCAHLFCRFGARLGLVGPFGELYLCISFASLFSRLLRPALVRDQDAANYPHPPQTPQTSLSTVKIVNKCDLFHYAR